MCLHIYIYTIYNFTTIYNYIQLITPVHCSFGIYVAYHQPRDSAHLFVRLAAATATLDLLKCCQKIDIGEIDNPNCNRIILIVLEKSQL